MKTSIFDYMDVRLFLQDFYQFRKDSDPAFSYASWAKELGFSNKTLLRLILQGKRQITSKSRQQFKLSLSLNLKETEYFDALIDYNQARTASERQAMGARFIQIQRQNFTQPQVSAEGGILQDAYGPIVLTTISSSDFAMHADELAKKLSLERSRLKTILEVLQKQGLIEERSGFYTASQSTFKIADTFGNQGLRNFYTYWIQKSAEAIDLPSEIRRFRSLQIALSENEFSEIVQKFNEFAVSILSRVENNTIQDRRLYLLNTVLFPVTEKL